MMPSSLPIPLLLFAAVALIFTLLKAARLRDVEEEIRRRLHHEETEHQRLMNQLEAEMQRVKQSKSSSLGALGPQSKD
jgi:hypothetical protein